MSYKQNTNEMAINNFWHGMHLRMLTSKVLTECFFRIVLYTLSWLMIEPWCQYLNLLKGIFWMFTKCHTFSCCNDTECLTILRLVNKQRRHFLRFRTFSIYSNLDVWTRWKLTFSFHIYTVSQWRVSVLFIFNLMPFIYFISDFYIQGFSIKKSCFTFTSLTYKLEILQKMTSHVIISSFQIIGILRTEWFKTTAADTQPIGHIWS